MMSVEPLSIEGGWLCTPTRHSDSRGSFMEWFRGDVLAAATGRIFNVLQANQSVSSNGVLRGVHYADVPPGQAKYVYCAVGAMLDVVVDLRVGSPTFGHHQALVLEDHTGQGVFIAEGLGHAFCALAEQTVVSYLVSETYAPDREHTVSPFDSDLGLPWRDHVDSPVVSERDESAPSLAEALASGRLPTYAACRSLYSSLGERK